MDPALILGGGNCVVLRHFASFSHGFPWFCFVLCQIATHHIALQQHLFCFSVIYMKFILIYLISGILNVKKIHQYSNLFDFKQKVKKCDIFYAFWGYPSIKTDEYPGY